MATLDPALCPRFHRAVELIGRRWSGAILRVMQAGASRFAEIKHAVPDISDKMLADRLKELEAEGLVARVVRDLWQRRPEGTYAIHPYHINLGDPEIQNDLTSRLGLPRFAAVVAADVVGSVDGSPSHAQTIDTEEQGSAARGYARRLATTIFAHSLATTQSIVGLHTGEVQQSFRTFVR